MDAPRLNLPKLPKFDLAKLPKLKLRKVDVSRLPLPDLVAAGIVTYVPMPEALHGKYQSYTQADIDALRKAGYEAPMLDVEQGVARYVESLISP